MQLPDNVVVHEPKVHAQGLWPLTVTVSHQIKRNVNQHKGLDTGCQDGVSILFFSNINITYIDIYIYAHAIHFIAL